MGQSSPNLSGDTSNPTISDLSSGRDSSVVSSKAAKQKANKESVNRSTGNSMGIKPALLGTVAAGTWLVGCGVYLSSTYGSLFTAAGQIAADGAGALGGAIAGVTLPLFLIMNWTKSESRARTLDRVIESRLAELDKVQILPENTGAHIEAINETFREEADKLMSTGEGILGLFSNLENKFANQSEKLKEMADSLSQRVDDMSRALDDQSARMVANEGRVAGLSEALNEATDHASQTAQAIVEKLEKPIDTASNRMETAAFNVRAHIEELWDQLENLETAYDATRAMAEEARGALSQEAHDIKHVAAFATQEIQGLSAQMIPQIDLIETMGRRAAEKTLEMQQHIDGQSHNLERVSEALRMQGDVLTEAVKEQASQLGELQEKVDSFGSTISTQFRKQVDTLIEVSEVAGEQVIEQATRGTDQLQGRLTAHTEKLSVVTEEVNQTVSGIVEQMDARMALLKESSIELQSSLDSSSEKTALKLQAELSTVVGNIEGRMDLIHTKAENMGEAVRVAGRDIEDHFEQSATNLRDSIKTSIQEMQIDTESLAEKIQTVLAEKSDTAGELLTTRLEAVDEAVLKLNNALYEQEQEFNTAADTRIDDSTQIFANKLEQLRTAASELDDKIAENGDASISKLVAKVDDFADQVEDRLAMVQDDAQNLRNQLDTTLVMIEDRTSKLGTNLLDGQESLRESFDASIDTMITQFMDRLKDARTLAETEVEAVRTELKTVTGEVQDMLDLSGSKIQTHAQELGASLNNASEEAMSKLGQLMASYEDDICNASNGAMARMVEVGQQLPDIAVALGESAEAALAKANLAGETFETQREGIAKIAGELQDYGTRLRTDLGSIPTELQTSFDKLETLVGESTGGMTENFTNLEAKITSSSQDFEISRNTMLAHLEEFNSLYEQLQKYGHNISDVVGEQVKSLTTSTDHAKRAWKDAREAMEAQATAATDVSDTYIDRMEELSRRAKTDVFDLTEASNTALASVETVAERVQDKLSGFTSTMGNLQHLIQNVGGVAEQHNALLKQSSQEAELHTSKLMASLSKNQQDTFLRSSAELVGQLNQIAIDVDSVLEGNLSNDVLRAYRDGDKSISVRRLLGKKSNSMSDVRIVEAYFTNASFRSKVDTYLRTFERLLGQAKDADASKLIHTAFLTGDLGKLYIFLTESLSDKKAA